MTICIPSENCGVNANYYSTERGLTFVTTDSDLCVISSEDYTTGSLASDCSNDYDGCNTGLVCALTIEVLNGNEDMTLCIPSENCGVNDNYYSAERGVTFSATVSDSCIKSKEDFVAGTIGSDCSLDKDGCDTGLVCALDIADG